MGKTLWGVRREKPPKRNNRKGVIGNGAPWEISQGESAKEGTSKEEHLKKS